MIAPFECSDSDGDTLAVRAGADNGTSFPMLVSVWNHADRSLNEVYLDEDALRRLLSWLSDTIST